MKHSILFSGHMIDAKDRAEPRFPPGKEDAAIEALRKKLLKEKETTKDKLFGIAGGACGGDILFHELCIETGIPSEIYLALPAKEFKKRSVSFAGKNWDRRFDILVSKLPVHILPDADKSVNDNNVWERANLWMLDLGLKNGGKNMTLITLWNGEAGDGKGGTKHMVEVAGKQGAKVEIIDANEL